MAKSKLCKNREGEKREMKFYNFFQAGIRGEVFLYNGTVVKMLSLENSAGKGPQSFKNLAAGITIVAAYKSTSGAIICSYKRTITPPAVSSLMYYDVNTPHHVVYAFGNTLSGGEPSKHAIGDYGTTDKKIFIESQVRIQF